jgi:hypothetical protein
MGEIGTRTVSNRHDSYMRRHISTVTTGSIMGQLDGRDGIRILLVTALLGAILLPAFGAPVDARPPPQAVCGVCSESLVDAAAENDIAIGVSDSELGIQIDRSGTGHWTANVTLTGPGVEPLRENASLRNRVVQRVFERGRVAVANPQSLSTSMTGNTLLVEYSVPDMAHESVGGVSVVDFFYWHGGDARWFYLAADSLTIQGPPGTVVTHAPDHTTTTDLAVTWTGSDQEYDPLGERTHIVFAPNSGISSSMATGVGIGLDVAQLKAQDLAAAGPPLGILAAVVVLLRRFGRRLAAMGRNRLTGIVFGPLVVLALLAATIETLGGVTGPLIDHLGDFLFYLVFVVAATGAGAVLVIGGAIVVGQLLLLRWLLERTTGETGLETEDAVTRLLLWPTATVLVGQWLFFPVAVAGAAGYDATYGLVSLILPAAFFVPLAVSHERGSRLHIAFRAAIVLASIPVVFAFAPHTGMTLVRVPLPVRYVPWALAVGAMGTVSYAWGRRLAATEYRSQNSRRHP